jgi:hypothetical protein
MAYISPEGRADGCTPSVSSGFAETLFGGMKPGYYSQILCLCANSLPSVRKIVARISQSVFVLLRRGYFLCGTS